MRRGDLVTVALPGDFGKPRPAVIVQADALTQAHDSVVLCQLTSSLADAPYVRVTVAPGRDNGLRVVSQIMADKPMTVRRARIGARMGSLNENDMARLDVALAFVLGLRL